MLDMSMALKEIAWQLSVVTKHSSGQRAAERLEPRKDSQALGKHPDSILRLIELRPELRQDRLQNAEEPQHMG